MTTEDLQREPDGIPHAVIGLTAMFCVVVAALLVATLMTGSASSGVAAVVLGFVAIPIVALHRKATHDRDGEHPSV